MGMKDLTPTERAQLHARQRAAKEARQRSAHSPGPGQYDLDKVDRYGANGTLSDMRGEGSTTWSFVSKSKQRGSVVGGKAQSGHVGPGAYTPQRTKKGENDSVACGRGDGNFASATINSKVPRGSPYGPSTTYAQNKFEDGPHVPSAASYSPQQDSHRRWSHNVATCTRHACATGEGGPPPAGRANGRGVGYVTYLAWCQTTLRPSRTHRHGAQLGSLADQGCPSVSNLTPALAPSPTSPPPSRRLFFALPSPCTPAFTLARGEHSPR